MAGRASKILIEIYGKDNTKRPVEEARGRFGKLGSQMGKLGGIAGLSLAGGFALAGHAAIEMGKAAAEDEQSTAKLANTLRKAAGATKGQLAQTERWITSMGKAYGVADDDLRPALSRLAVATGSVSKAQKLTRLAMDVSAGSGKSLSTVTMALAKAQTGSLGGLARLGIQTKDLHGKTLSLAQVTQLLTDKYKGSAATAADTTAGKQQKLKVAYHELQEQIGAQLLPVMQKLTDVGLKVVDWLSKNPQVVKYFAVAVGVLAVAFAGAFVAANALPIAIAAIVTGLIYAYTHFKTFRDIVNTTAHVIATAFTWLYNNVLSRVFKLILMDIGVQLIAWGKLISVMGHIPGFGWAKKLGADMQTAGHKAIDLADNIHRIPTKHSTTITTPGMSGAISQSRTLLNLLSGINHMKNASTKSAPGMFQPKAHALGTNYASGGWAKVGETGMELVNLPRGAQVIPHKESMALMSGTTRRGDGGDTYNLTVNGFVGSEEQLATKFEQMLTKRRNTVGRPLAFA